MSMKKSNVLITGGSGYYGELLTEKLISKNFKCRIFDINPPGNSLIDRVDYIKGDIRNVDEVNKSVKDIDIVFHNVAQVPLAKNNKLFNDVNFKGTENILKASLNNNVSHFVYTSSSAIYGVPNHNPVLETMKPVPGEKYGKAKLEGEKLTLEYSKYGMNCSIIRPRTILGNGRLGIFQILFEWIYNGDNIPVFDGGNNVYQFIHAEDLANATIASTNINKTAIYNIGTDRFCSIYETLDFLIKEVGSKSKIKSLNSKLIVPFMTLSSKLGISPLGAYHSLMYGKSMYFDISKAKSELNWTPLYSNKEMIIESYNYYVHNRDTILNPVSVTSTHKSKVKKGILSFLPKII